MGESVEFLTRCDTPPPAEIVDYNVALTGHITKADSAIDNVGKQLRSPSMLDGSFTDQAQALTNKWHVIKLESNERIGRLSEMYENAERLLRDVDVAIEWLNKHRLLDRIKSGKLAYQRETDKDAKLDLVQKQIDELKTLVTESRQQEKIILNFNMAMKEARCEDDDKLDQLHSEWVDFNAQLNGWMNTIEREIRKSDEYDSVITDVESVLTEIKRCKTSDPKFEQLQADLRGLKERVEVLENLGAELSTIERQMSPSPSTSSSTSSSSSNDSLVGFQTLRIIRDICDKELNTSIKVETDLHHEMINATDEDKLDMGDVRSSTPNIMNENFNKEHDLQEKAKENLKEEEKA